MSELEQSSTCSTFSSRRSCTLIITHQCNLDCTYCYESHKSNKKMPLELAKEIITREFDLVDKTGEFTELCIDFFGGEALLQFDVISNLAEWIWSRPRPVPYILFASTNGTLINDRIKFWFERHCEKFYLSLSLDGSPDSQEKNRKGSFSRIDVDFFRHLWPTQPVKMTVSPETLRNLAADVIYLQRLGFIVQFNPAQGVAWSEADAETYEEQLNILADFYLTEGKDIAPVKMLTIDFLSVIDEEPVVRKFCGTGTHMVTYDVDGNSFPCHMFTPLVMGPGGSAGLNIADFSNPACLVDPDCAGCFLLRICPTCYGFNYRYRSNISLRDRHFCEMYKRQAKVSCQFQLEMLMRNGTPTTSEGMTNAKALLHTYDCFNSLA